MKALIEMNYSSSRVLTMFLGNKHDSSSWNEMSESMGAESELEFDLTGNEKMEISCSVENKSLPLLINIKEPIPWLDSYFRYQKKKILYINPDDNPLFSVSWARRNLAMWEEKVTSWLKIASDHPETCQVIEHMQIIEDPENILMEIFDRFHLDVSSTNVISTVENRMKRGHYSEHGKNLIDPFHKFDPSFHLERKWLVDYPEDVLAFVIEETQEMEDRHPFLKDFGLEMSKHI